MEELLSIIAAALSLALLGLRLWWVRVYRATGIESAIKGAQRIQTALNVARGDSGAATAVLLVASNGGTVPRPGAIIKSTAVYASSEHDTRLSSRWSAIQVDGTHLSLLVQLQQQPLAYACCEELDGELGELLRSRGACCLLLANVSRSSFWRLVLPPRRTRWWYVALIFADGHTVGEKERESIRELVQAIREVGLT